MADSSPHRRHDRFAIAAAVSDGLALGAMRSCPSCGALHADLVTLRTAMRHAWTPRRTREMVLSPDIAARLRRGRWRRMLEAIGTRHDLVTRPVALSLASLGLVGMLVSWFAPGMSGMAATQELARGTGPATVMIAGGSAPPVDVAAPAAGHEPTTQDPAIDPLAMVSMGLLVGSGAIFGARRLAHRRDAMR